jgi:hypothetical protein
VPGYIRYWDGSKWVPGTSKPMPTKGGGSGDAENSAESTAGSAGTASPNSLSAVESAEPETASGGSLPPFQEATGSASASASAPAAAPQPKAPAFAPPRPLSEVSFDDAKPSSSTFPGRPAPGFPGASPEQNAPSFSPPRPLSETSFDDLLPPETPRQASPQPPAPPMSAGFGAGAGLATGPAPGPAIGGMGISISGAGMPVAPKQTPAQMSAGNQSLRIRLLRPDGKPFDGPEITTGPKASDSPQGPARTEFDTPRGPKKQAPKVVVKSGPLERAGHTLAVLLISAVGIVPLGYLLLQSVHDREDKLAAHITVPTKMNVLDTTSEGYLGGMAAVLLVVTVLYWSRLRKRRTR